MQYIQNTLRQCAVELVVIGPHWLDARDPQGGNRRLDDPHDFVRLEIETALSLGLTIIPLPVDSATMPASVDLPESLRSLTILNALQVRNDPDFARDMERVMAGVERGFASRPGGSLAGVGHPLHAINRLLQNHKNLLRINQLLQCTRLHSRQQ